MRIYGIKELTEDILKKKGIRKTVLGERIGASPQLTTALIDSEDPKLSTVTRLCNGMGVELCIIDGWRKYRMNEIVGNVDFDTMFEDMRGRFGSEQSEDRWKEQRVLIEERKLKARERAKAYIESERGRERYKARLERKRKEELEVKGDVCLNCARCEVRLEKGFRHWCNGSNRYEAKPRCPYFILREELVKGAGDEEHIQ